MYTDQQKIDISRLLFAEGYIGAKDLKSLRYTCNDGTYTIVDDTEYPVDVCDNGDVYIHRGGSYPYVLKGFADRV